MIQSDGGIFHSVLIIEEKRRPTTIAGPIATRAQTAGTTLGILETVIMRNFVTVLYCLVQIRLIFSTWHALRA